jgi:ABC-2 type transport system permease protein
MIFRQVLVMVIKETRVILRDKEALLILFAMPTLFVTIMSLAQQDAFKEKGGVTLPLTIINKDGGKTGQDIIDALGERKGFTLEVAGVGADEAKIKEDVAAGRRKFAVIIPASATEKADAIAQAYFGKDPSRDAIKIGFYSDPSMQGSIRKIAVSSLNRVLQGIETKALLTQVARMNERMTMGLPGGLKPPATPKQARLFMEVDDDVSGGAAPFPTSVQQNMPAWTLFAMFFLVIPLSATFVREAQQGSLARLKSMPAPAWVFVAGKMIPYFIINQAQFVLMMLTGMFLLPLFGSETLEIGDSWGGMALLAASASYAAIGYGLLVATFCRTSEQATTFGGTSVLILAATGGIMVPKFVMPAYLQNATAISPMSWGLEGFLNLFVRNGTIHDVIPHSLRLSAFASFCIGIAIWRLYRMLSR